MEGGSELSSDNPFAQLGSLDLPKAKPQPVVSTPKPQLPKKEKKRGRVDVGREKAGRGGKWVTVAKGEGFTHTNPQELERYLKTLKNRLGCGGALKGKILEIQGDQKEQVGNFLTELGFRVVFVGG